MPTKINKHKHWLVECSTGKLGRRASLVRFGRSVDVVGRRIRPRQPNRSGPVYVEHMIVAVGDRRGGRIDLQAHLPSCKANERHSDDGAAGPRSPWTGAGIRIVTKNAHFHRNRCSYEAILLLLLRTASIGFGFSPFGTRTERMPLALECCTRRTLPCTTRTMLIIILSGDLVTH